MGRVIWIYPTLFNGLSVVVLGRLSQACTKVAAQSNVKMTTFLLADDVGM
jgi:hypothetical protein